LHTLHFRPGAPQIKMQWDLEHSIVVQCSSQDIVMRLDCNTPHALLASLNFWIRPGVDIVEGQTTTTLHAGDAHSLRGGAAVSIRSHTGELRIEGLPLACHAMRLLPRQPIPSSMPATCAVLCLGLRFPVHLQLRFCFSKV
jgi:hypothetical protein